MVFINGVLERTALATDRGLLYGDGIFRTVECHAGRPRWWSYHYRCLAHDVASLGLPLPDEAVLLDEIYQLTACYPRAVAKVIVTRGESQRGYAIPDDLCPTRMVYATPWSGYPKVWWQGITVRLCDFSLAIQPRLAGIKHLNRLEQVLARSEWSDPSIQEGLLRDSEGFFVEGTMTNLFLLKDERWVTPLLDRCGVSGAFRAWMHDHYDVIEQRVTLEAIINAEVVLLGNSLTGPCQVKQLMGVCCWRPSSLVPSINRHFSSDAGSA